MWVGKEERVFISAYVPGLERRRRQIIVLRDFNAQMDDVLYQGIIGV